jgi:ariadne-1
MNAKRDLDRYIHYYKRWNDHRLSLTFAQKQVTKLHDQLFASSNEHFLNSEMLSTVTSPESQFNISQWRAHSSIAKQQLLRAAELIVECRRVLQHTYVLGYFVDDQSTEKQLFEFSQSMLEHHTEMLHEVTELYIGARDDINPPEMDSGKVINMTMVTEKFLNSLMDCMRGGVLLMRAMN